MVYEIKISERDLEVVNISSVRFKNFKALKSYSVSLDTCNILVGPNNSGKSTIISAFRILDAAFRCANSRSPEYINFEERRVLGHKVPVNGLPVSLENVHTDYEYAGTKIEYRFDNGNKIYLGFPEDGGCIMTWECPGAPIKSVSGFKKAFPFSIQVIPVLGPLEHEEVLVTEDTVRRSLGTPKACRHFRNFWYQRPEGFDSFKEMVENSWPGMSVKKVEITDILARKLSMFCTEGRMDREVFWAGFGFQIWCQLLTHLSRSKEFSMTVVDEPEVYLHPDLQRQLLGLLRDHTNDFVIATHSTEIIGDADPAEILIVDKSKNSAKRVRDVEGVQEALDALGSIQNMTLTQLARNKRVLFMEGSHDYKVIRRFARKLKYIELAAGNDITQLESGGYSSWPKVRALAWGLKNTLGADIQIAAVYDRDYWCEAETDKVLSELKSDLKFAHIHLRKEIENYLLVPSVLDRCVKASLREKAKRGSTGKVEEPNVDIYKILDRLSVKFQTELQGQYISKFSEFHRSQGKDGATLAREALDFFHKKWDDIDRRMEIVCGKTILKELRGYALDTWGISLTDFKIIDEFRADEVPVDLHMFIKDLEAYRVSGNL